MRFERQYKRQGWDYERESEKFKELQDDQFGIFPASCDIIYRYIYVYPAEKLQQ